MRPELVVEIAFDGVQTSPRYPGGMALRFARVLRYRAGQAAGGGRHDRRGARDPRRVRSGQPAPSREGEARRRGPVPETSRRLRPGAPRGPGGDSGLGEPPRPRRCRQEYQRGPDRRKTPGWASARPTTRGGRAARSAWPAAASTVVVAEPAKPHGPGPGLQLLVPGMHRREVPLEVSAELERVGVQGQPLHLGAVLRLGEHTRTAMRCRARGVRRRSWGLQHGCAAQGLGASRCHRAPVWPRSPVVDSSSTCS